MVIEVPPIENHGILDYRHNRHSREGGSPEQLIKTGFPPTRE